VPVVSPELLLWPRVHQHTRQPYRAAVPVAMQLMPRRAGVVRQDAHAVVLTKPYGSAPANVRFWPMSAGRADLRDTLSPDRRVKNLWWWVRDRYVGRFGSIPGGGFDWNAHSLASGKKHLRESFIGWTRPDGDLHLARSIPAEALTCPSWEPKFRY